MKKYHGLYFRCLGLILFLVSYSQSFSQHPNVLISTSHYPNEPSISINPGNTNQLVAASNMENFYISSDGGLTWTEGILESPWGVNGDPCIVCDTAGNFYFFHLSDPPGGGNWLDRIVCQKLPSGSTQWSPGSYTYHLAGKHQDKEWAFVNPLNNEIYATWTQFDQYGSSDPQDSTLILFSKSSDGGESWYGMRRLSQHGGNCLDGDSTVEGAVPAVGPDNEIYVSWSSPQGIYFDRSLDGGNTWLDQDIFVCSQPGGWDFDIPGIARCNGFPVTCCDMSNSPYRGNIYINFSDQRNGDTDTDIWLIKSSDGGNTWSTLKRVNDDPPGKHQFFTWMTIDQTNGYLYFVFYDRRNHSYENTDVYMAVSKDGGETFTNFKVSESPFLPEPTIFFGDYTNITAHNNVIRPIWTRLHNDNLSIYTAIVDPTAVGIQEDITSPFAITEVYPNPFEYCTHLSYKIVQNCHITIKIMNSLGKEIITLMDNEEKTTGRYIETFNSEQYQLTPGVYFFQLTSDASLEKRQMILIE
jgi:hypothetical protein